MWDLRCGMHVASSSLTRDPTQVPCIRSTESYLPDHQGSPPKTSISSSAKWEDSLGTSGMQRAGKREQIRAEGRQNEDGGVGVEEQEEVTGSFSLDLFEFTTGAEK